MLNRIIQSIVFFGSWALSFIGLTWYIIHDGQFGLILGIFSYAFFLTFQLIKFRKLNSMMISKELLIARPDHSFREEVENKFFPPILVSVLYVVLLVSDKYEPIVIYALPVGFYLILWVFSLVHYELYYGLILTKDRIIWPKDNIKLESIASFLVNSSGELEVLSMYHLEDKKVNLKKFNISDVHSIVKVLKTKKEIKIDGQKPEDFWSKSFVDLF